MRETLFTLKAYQEVLVRIAELEQALAFVPPGVTQLEKEWKSIKDRIDGLETQQSKLEGELKEKKLRLEELDQKSQKFEEDLHKVTNSKEYNAVLKEIDLAKKQNHALTEEIEKQNTELTETRTNRTECDGLEKTSRKSYESALAEYRATQKENESELKVRIGERDKVAKKIPKRLHAQFTRIASRRNGVGLAMCVGAVCQGCFVRVRPRVVDELRRFNSLINCENCKRILLYHETD